MKPPVSEVPLCAKRPCPLAVLVITVLLTGPACSKTERDVVTQEPNIIEDGIELETELFIDEVEADYVLVRPMWENALAVTDTGDILVLDEDWVKIYGADGSPRRRFGGPGRGPGEFQRALHLWLGPSGLLTVMDASHHVHFFGPDHVFKERRDPFRGTDDVQTLSEQDLRFEGFQRIYRLDEDRSIYVVKARSIASEEREHDQFFYFLQEGDRVEVFARYPDTATVGVSGSFYFDSSQGAPLLEPISSDLIAFAHTRIDSEPAHSPPTYSIRLLDLSSGEERRITRVYQPEPTRWEPLTYPESTLQRMPAEMRARVEAQNIAIADFYADRPYQVGLQRIHADGGFLFAWTHTRGEHGQGALVDVFEVKSCAYIASAWFPEGMSMVIRGGYLYILSQFEGPGEPFTLRKYRIDPGLFGRP